MGYWTNPSGWLGKAARAIAARRTERTSRANESEKRAHKQVNQGTPPRSPSAAKRAADAVPGPRIKLPVLRAGFRKSKARQRYWSKQAPSAKSGAARRIPSDAGVFFRAVFSPGGKNSHPKTCFASSSFFREDQIERWRAIKSKQLPPGDEVPEPPSAEQRAEEEKEIIDAIVDAAQRRVDQVAEPARERMQPLRRQAEQLYEQAEEASQEDPEVALSLQRRAESIAEEIREIAAQASADIARINDELNESRAEARAEILQRFAAMDQAKTDRIDELTEGLEQEVIRAVQQQYFEDHGHPAPPEDGVDEVEIQF